MFQILILLNIIGLHHVEIWPRGCITLVHSQNQIKAQPANHSALFWVWDSHSSWVYNLEACLRGFREGKMIQTNLQSNIG